MKRLLFISVVTVGFALAGCHKNSPEQKTAELPVAVVRVQAAERKPFAATEDVVGTVRPQLSASIEGKVSGRIEEMRVVPGQMVKTGELLAKLDAREIQARLDQTSAALQQAESDFKRAADLLQQKILSQSEYDGAQSRFRVAEATQAEAKTMLGYTKILAPFDGVITRKLADVGDLAMPGKPLMQMENPARLRLDADVPEALISNVKLGDSLAVRVAAATGEITGVVSEMSPAADPNSRTYLVKLDLPESVNLRSGQFGRVAVPVGEVDSIRVPAATVVQRGQMEMVFVAVSGHAQLRLVKTGRRSAGEIEIVSGLNAGEPVVVDSVDHLADGQPLTLKP
jgi:RND family efflux transporter MFP subunit